MISDIYVYFTKWEGTRWNQCLLFQGRSSGCRYIYWAWTVFLSALFSIERERGLLYLGTLLRFTFEHYCFDHKRTDTLGLFRIYHSIKVKYLGLSIVWSSVRIMEAIHHWSRPASAVGSLGLLSLRIANQLRKSLLNFVEVFIPLGTTLLWVFLVIWNIHKLLLRRTLHDWYLRPLTTIKSLFPRDKRLVFLNTSYLRN